MIKTMKKIYVTPEIVNVEMMAEPVMTAVSGETTGAGVGNGSAGSNTPNPSAGNRGDWGNLWN